MEMCDGGRDVVIARERGAECGTRRLMEFNTQQGYRVRPDEWAPADVELFKRREANWLDVNCERLLDYH